MTLIVALNTVGDKPDTVVLAMWSEDMKRTCDVQVTKIKLAAMKQKKKYKFLEWTELAEGYLNATIVNSEEELG